MATHFNDVDEGIWAGFKFGVGVGLALGAVFGLSIAMIWMLV